MTLRPNPGRHRQVGRDHENATGPRVSRDSRA
jgi:hypothetical protein